MPLSTGTRLGPYEVVTLIGAGGMGEVYRARDPRLGRDVAIKVLPADRSRDDDAVARFEREARAVAAISHPNILAVFDVGREGDVSYLVAELLKGESLRARLDRGPLPWPKAAEIAGAIAAGLAAAHDHGVIHRDVKPENLFLTANGHVKILDFGLARLRPALTELQTATATAATDPGTVLGTVGYMSPEQVRGDAIDARSDLFALGCVMHEMVTGRRAFQRATAVETMAAILNDEPAEPGDSTKRLPPELHVIVQHCLEKRPGDRFQTAHDLAFALRTALSGSTSAAGVPSAVNRRVSMWVGWAALIALALTVTWAYRTFWRSPLVDTASAVVTRLTNSGRASSPAISPDGRLVVYVDDGAAGASLRVHQLTTGSDVVLVEASGRDLARPTFSRDGSYVYYLAGDPSIFSFAIYRVPAVGGPAREIVKDAVEGPVFSHDGRSMAFLRWDQPGSMFRIVVAASDGADARVLASIDEPAHAPLAWSPDGGELLVALSGRTNATISAVSVKDGRTRAVAENLWFYASHPIWLSDGRGVLLLAFANRNEPSQVWHFDPETRATRRLTNDMSQFATLSATADGETMVAQVAESDGDVWIGRAGDARSWRRIERDATRRDGIGGIEWLPDGRLLYTTRNQGVRQIWVMAADGSGRRQLGPPGDSRAPAISRDGRAIAYMSWRHPDLNIWRMDADGGNPRRLTNVDLANFPAWSADGKWIAFYGQVNKTFAMYRMPAEGGEPVLLSAELFSDPAISPDGKWLAAVHIDPQQRAMVALVPFPDGGPLRSLPASMPIGLGGVLWLPDGTLVCHRQEGRRSNLWRLPLDGGAPTPLTTFDEGGIADVAASQDGRLAVVRSRNTEDVLLITGVKDLLRRR